MVSPSAVIITCGIRVKESNSSADVVLHFLCKRNTLSRQIIMPRPLIGGALSDAFEWRLTSVWRLSRTSGLSREHIGLRRPKLAQTKPTSHVTRTPLSRSKGQRPRSPGRFTHRGLNAWGRCRGDRENVLGVGNHYYIASARRRARPLGAHGGGEGRGISCRHTHSLF